MRKLLVIFLALLPYQWQFSNILAARGFTLLALSVKAVDELFILGSILWIFVRMFKGPRFVVLEKSLIVPIIFISMWDVISGIANANNPLITTLGCFFHLKNFFATFLFSSLCWTGKELKEGYRILRNMGIFLAIVAILQEIIALINKYTPISIPICWPAWTHEWRAGFYRSPSLVGHPNILGIYLLLILSMELRVGKNGFILFLLLLGVLTTLSRIVYLCLIVLLSLSFKRVKLPIKLMFIGIALVFIISVSQLSLAELGVSSISSKEIGEQRKLKLSYFRGYTLKKSLEIWRDHLIFGVGPGMYGDVISFLINSPIYEEYNFDPFFLGFAKIGKGLDQFYPVILAESGSFSLLLYLMFFILLIKISLLLSRKFSTEFEKKLAKGLANVPIILLILLTVKSINMSYFLLPYFSLLGMLIGYWRACEKQRKLLCAKPNS